MKSAASTKNQIIDYQKATKNYYCIPKESTLPINHPDGPMFHIVAS
jgi:hypothetical protein